MDLLKLIKILLLLLFSTAICQAQTSFNISNKTTGDTLLTIDNSGNVGIGTTTPGSSIDIKSATVDASSSFNLGNLDGTRFLRFSSGSASFNPLIRWHEGEALRFATWTDTFTERLRISANGNLGIGTDDPTSKLDMQMSGNGAWQRAIRVLNPDMVADDGLFLVLGKSDDTRNMGYMSFKFTDDASNANRLSFGLYGVNYVLNITGDGNVGIGTTSPSEMLEVADTIYSSVGGFKFPDQTVQTTAAGAGFGNTLDQAYDQGGAGVGRIITADAGAININGNGGLNVSGTIQVDNGLVLNGSGSEGGQLSLLDGDGNGGWEVDNFGSTDTEQLRFFRGRGYNDLFNVLVINNEGNIGIGTSTPSEKLTVNDTIYSTVGGFKFPDQSVQTTAFTAGGGNTLDQAYDQGSSGAGRTITADAGAFEVSGVDGVLFEGSLSTGSVPGEGAGVRMMWYPAKSAFRSGFVDDTQWDQDSIGIYSFAAGYNTKAKGDKSVAMGGRCVATGDNSIAMGRLTSATGAHAIALGSGSQATGSYASAFGRNTSARGIASTAMGSNTEATNSYSTAMGYGTTASGLYSLAMGYNTTTMGSYSTAIGRGITVQGNYAVGIALSDQNGQWLTQDNTMAIIGGNVGIGTISPASELTVSGTVECDILEINGGGDIAEPFDVDQTMGIEAGMVMTIDSDNPGKLKISKNAYDRCVAGIISGAGGINPGLIMGQTGSIANGEFPVAMTGRVYCRADASNGTINPGDLLTTSDIPGHAMKVVDYTKAQGAVIGKAMSSLDEGQGLILVLVSLQ